MLIEKVLEICDRVMREAAEKKAGKGFPRSTLEEGRDAVAGGQNTARRTQNIPTVLLVEDEAASLQNLSQALRSWGCKVLPAASGHAAINICEDYRGKIDVLVSKTAVGAVDGFELAAVARLVHPHVIVLLISESGAQRVAEGSGVDEFLEKPLKYEMLWKAIARRTGL